MSRYKWTKGLPSGLISDILAEEPRTVQFTITAPETVMCVIICAHGRGYGMAICSTLDRSIFNVKEGKKRAAGRALGAVVRRNDNDRIRTSRSTFPRTWKPAQIKRVAELGDTICSKSFYRARWS